jgi:hypothetical protein
MKALISAFALLSFVAATTIPTVADAQLAQTTPAQKKAAQKHAQKAADTKKKAAAARKKRMAPKNDDQ